MSESKFCPILNKPCIKDECVWYVEIDGNHPNTGRPITQSQCSVGTLIPIILENAQRHRAKTFTIHTFKDNKIHYATDLANLLQIILSRLNDF